MYSGLEISLLCFGIWTLWAFSQYGLSHANELGRRILQHIFIAFQLEANGRTINMFPFRSIPFSTQNCESSLPVFGLPTMSSGSVHHCMQGGRSNAVSNLDKLKKVGWKRCKDVMKSRSRCRLHGGANRGKFPAMLKVFLISCCVYTSLSSLPVRCCTKQNLTFELDVTFRLFRSNVNIL